MEKDELTEKIIGCVFRVHSALGSGFLESVYKNALLLELMKHGIGAVAEVPIQVFYDGEPVGDFFADIVVDGSVILELKAVSRLETIHEIQLVNYLKATGIEVGLLVNFGGQSAEIRRKYRSNSKSC